MYHIKFSMNMLRFFQAISKMVESRLSSDAISKSKVESAKVNLHFLFYVKSNYEICNDSDMPICSLWQELVSLTR